MIPGIYSIRCIRPGGRTLTNYGQYAFTEGEVLDLLAETTPDTIKANDYSTARTMCEDIGFELAQRIAAGEFVVAERVAPDEQGDPS